MPDSTKRSSSARSKSKSSSGGPSKPTNARSSPARRPAAAASRSRSSHAASGAGRAKSANGAARSSGSRSGASSQGNGAVHNVADTIGTAAQKARSPLVAGGAAAAGLAGGFVLGARILTPRKKILGIPIARKGLSFKPVVKEVSKVSQQLGKLTDEMSQARKQAKKVGDALS